MPVWPYSPTAKISRLHREDQGSIPCRAIFILKI